MISTLKFLAVSALLLTTLTACEPSGTDAALPPIPADVRVCFASVVPAPRPGAMTAAEIARLIADLRRSDLAKTQCGRRLIGFYDTVAAELKR